jgi:sugar lactone lactonase YvrE/subtilisin-like proprotein convertase family protein
MNVLSLLHRCLGRPFAAPAGQRPARRRRQAAPRRLRLRPLEDRTLLSTYAISGPGSIVLGSPYPLNLTSDSTTIADWTINWGDGNLQTVSGNPSSVTHTFASPASVNISATVTDGTGTHAAGVGSGGQSLGALVTNAQLGSPVGLAYGPDGNLYVSGGNGEVMRFNGTTGVFIDNYAANAGSYLAFGPDGSLYATNGNGQVWRYSSNPAGPFASIFVSAQGLSPVSLTFGPDGNLYVTAGANNSVLRYSGQTGALIGTFVTSGSGGLSGPTDLTFGPDGNLYVSSSGNNEVIRYSGTTGAFLNVFAANNSQNSALSAPRGLRFGPDGNLYVSSYLAGSGHLDAGSDSEVLQYNGATGAFMSVFVSNGSGGLHTPQGLAFGPDGNLYVSSGRSGAVLRYSGSTGAFLGAFTPPPSNSAVSGAAIGPDGDLYVSSPGGNDVLRLDSSTGALLNVFAQGGGLNGPGALAFSPGGNLYVMSAQGVVGGNQVLRYDGNGNLLNTFNLPNESLNSPSDMVRGPDGNFYVTNEGIFGIGAGGGEVLRFNGTTGAYMGVFVASPPNGVITPTTLDEPIVLLFGPDGNLYVAGQSSNNVMRYYGPNAANPGAPDPAPGQSAAVFVAAGSGGLSSPDGMAFGPDGNLYVSSNGSSQVLEYSGSTGAYLTRFITSVKGPTGLLFGADGSLYVSSSGTGSVLHYSSKGKSLGAFVAAGSGGLKQPVGLAFGPDGNFYVADSGNPADGVLEYNGATGAFLKAFAPVGDGVSQSMNLLFSGNYLYVTARGSNRVLRYNASTDALVDTYLYTFTPTAMTVGPDGNLYVVTGPNPDSNVVQVACFNGTSGAFIKNFVPSGNNGGLQNPTAMLFGPDGNLYVASGTTGQVLRYSGTTGAPLGAFASGGGLNGPNGLAFGPDGDLYVSSAGTDEVYQYDGGTGAVLGSFVPPASGGLNGPQTLLFGSDRNLLVLSSGTGSVLHYNGPLATTAASQIPVNVVQAHNYTGANLPLSIPAGATVTATLTVSDNYTIADVNAQLSITDPADSDLSAYLVGPDGTRVVLFSGVGGSGANFTSTVLDDQAALPVGSGAAPFTGGFQPQGQLTAFNGRNVQGTWSLVITNASTTHSGTLTAWSLTIVDPPAAGEGQPPSTPSAAAVQGRAAGPAPGLLGGGWVPTWSSPLDAGPTGPSGDTLASMTPPAAETTQATVAAAQGTPDQRAWETGERAIPPQVLDQLFADLGETTWAVLATGWKG